MAGAPEPPTTWLTLDQVASELQIPLRTIYGWRSRGLGPRGHKIGKHIRVKRSDLDKWLETQADPRAS